MQRFNILSDFYRCSEWLSFRKQYIANRLLECGELRDDFTGQIITDAKDIVLHHITPLTMQNVYDVNVSLNSENIQLVTHRSHNEIHERFGFQKRRAVYVVYGAPCSGKSSYVKKNVSRGDIVLDIDALYKTIGLVELYDKPKEINSVVFAVRNTIIDSIETRLGDWSTAWIVGGYPHERDREELVRKLDAELIYIEATKADCLRRLHEDEARRNYFDKWEKYINEWFSAFSRTEYIEKINVNQPLW